MADPATYECATIAHMPLEGFDFSCVVTLPDASVAEVEQTDVQRGPRQDMTFFMTVRPHAQQKKFTGELHLSGPSLTNLDACPGDSRAEKSQRVADALRAWVNEHGLSPDFALDVTLGGGTGHPCRVSVSAR